MTLSVLDAARECPDRPALIVGGETTTFDELAERALHRMRALSALGLPAPGRKPVTLVGTSDLDTLETLFALFELGQPVALLHPRLTPSERQGLLELVTPAVHLDDAFVHSRPAAAPSPLPSPDPIDPETPLCILFTSGTTGTPKGVVLSRRAFLASARGSEENLGFSDGDRWLLGLPIAHVGGLSILTRCLIARRTVVVPEAVARGLRFDVEALAQSLEQDRVTLVSLVPTQLEWLLSREPAWHPPPSLRAVLLGGAAARPALLERAAGRGVPVLTTYGLTEACSQVTTQRRGTVNRGELGSGAPMPGTELRIVDGAIQVRGPTLLSAYHPPTSVSPLDADGWLHTNDLGRIDEHGDLHVLGRSSDLVITGGENVVPLEVEVVLERCPGVAAACVFGVPDVTWGEIVAAAIVPGPDGPPDAGALGAFVRDHLASHRRPRRVAFVPALEATAAGKLDRRETARRATPRLVVLPSG